MLPDSTNPRVMADNIKKLVADNISQDAELEALDDKIESLQIYDDAEIDTGKKWIDGSSIYRKCFLISEGLPNNTTSTFVHGISNLSVILAVDAILISSSDMRPLNYGSNYIRFNNASILVQSNADISANSLYLTLEYTKVVTPTPDVLPSPDPDTRSLEEVEEPINEEPKKEEK